ncbi:MAG TPA: hypothetical protein VEX18_19265 [Polyangiaceae bacterium]|nr:hypothetical protein [Polyangiaceae bacterium]
MKPADDEHELTRLLAAEKDALGGSADLLRQRGPDATQLASLSSRLALQGIDVGAPLPSPAPRPWKTWVLGGGGGAATAALLWLALRAPQPPPAALGPQVDSPQPAASLQAKARATGTSGMIGSPRGAAPAPSSDGPAASTDAPAPVTSATAEPAGPGPGVPRGPRDQGERSGSVPAGALENRAQSVAVPRVTGAAAPSPSSSIPTEIELLRDARFALKQSPARALELTEQHARFHPRGELSQERELIAMTALVALGRRTAALARSASFERAFPGSAYRKQLSELLR